MNTATQEIFISYSRRDMELARRIKDSIEEVTGVNCWMDLDCIECGEKYEDVIVKAIDAAKVVVFFLSANSMQSEWTKEEVRYAMKTGKKVIPVCIDNCELRGWYLLKLSGLDIVDYSNTPQRHKLMQNICKWTGRPPLSSAESMAGADDDFVDKVTVISEGPGGMDPFLSGQLIPWSTIGGTEPAAPKPRTPAAAPEPLADAAPEPIAAPLAATPAAKKRLVAGLVGYLRRFRVLILVVLGVILLALGVVYYQDNYGGNYISTHNLYDDSDDDYGDADDTRTKTYSWPTISAAGDDYFAVPEVTLSDQYCSIDIIVYDADPTNPFCISDSTCITNYDEGTTYPIASYERLSDTSEVFADKGHEGYDSEFEHRYRLYFPPIPNDLTVFGLWDFEYEWNIFTISL